MSPARFRARFRRDGAGYWFSIVDQHNVVVRESWCAGRKYDAATNAEAELRLLNTEAA